MIHEHDALQLLAVTERTDTDAESALGDVDPLQRQTSVEGLIADGIDTFRQIRGRAVSNPGKPASANC